MRLLKIKQTMVVAASVSAALCLGSANADTLNGSGGSWQSASSWTQAQLYGGTSPTPGTPYWNNNSGDGPKGNIGWCLTGGSTTCTMSGGPNTTLPYFGTSSGASVANMYFTSTGLPVSLTVDGIHTNEIIADAYDVFGYYEVPASGTPNLIPLLSTNPSGASPATVGSTVTFDPTGNYGYYIENIKGAGTAFESDYFFYMNDGWDQELSLGPDSLQHFAVFQDGSNYIIGDVDGVGCTNNVACVAPTDFDYQDIVITATNTPEPTTLGLMGGSLLLLGGLLRRKLRHSS